MLRRGFPFIAVLICLIVSSLSYAQVSTLNEPRKTSWEKTKDQEDIVIYEGDVRADGAVPLKGHIIINHPIENVVTVMADTQGKKNWLPAVKVINIVEQSSDYHKVEYFQVKMPFIVSNRTTVLESVASVNETKDEIIVKVFSSERFPEKNKSFVRAKMLFGEVRLRSVDKRRKTIVSGIFYTSPEGMLPNWLVKRFTRQFVYQSLEKLRVIVGRNLYDQKSVQKYADLISNYGKKSRGISSQPKKKSN